MRLKSSLCILALAAAVVTGLAWSSQTAEAVSVDQVVKAAATTDLANMDSQHRGYGYHGYHGGYGGYHGGYHGYYGYHGYGYRGYYGYRGWFGGYGGYGCN